MHVNIYSLNEKIAFLLMQIISNYIPLSQNKNPTIYPHDNLWYDDIHKIYAGNLQLIRYNLVLTFWGHLIVSYK
jgi:hypothetical protein